MFTDLPPDNRTVDQFVAVDASFGSFKSFETLSANETI
jgi:hypothetical protein